MVLACRQSDCEARVSSKALRFDAVRQFYTKSVIRIKEYPVLAALLLLINAILWPILGNMLANHLDSNLTITLLFIVILSILVLIVIMVLNSPSGQLPDDFKLGNYQIRRVSTPALIREANKITYMAFREATLNGDAVQEILLKNKDACLGLIEKTSQDGFEKLVGYASCWPITKDAYERMRLGEGDPRGMSEADLTADHVLKDTEIDKAEILFIPGVAVRGLFTRMGHKRAAVLMCAFLEHIKIVYSPVARSGRSTKIFLVGSTRAGQKLAEKMLSQLGRRILKEDIILFQKRVPFYEVTIYPADWDFAFEKAEAALFRDLFLPGGAE
jgi:hypothetical protein